MRTIVVLTLLLAGCALSNARAAPALVCAQNDAKSQVMCFAKDGVRENGVIRAAVLWQGDPKNIKESGSTARVHCGNGGLELIDRKGMASVRRVPPAQLGKDFVTFLCENTPTKQDPKLKTN